MPNKVWSIHDFGGGGAAAASGDDHDERSKDHPSAGIRSATAAASASRASSSASNAAAAAAAPLTVKVCHIPNLHNPEYAKELILRVVREFQPILTRRNYNVRSISELCCCSDGLDFEPTAAGGKRRKRQRMSNNVWGYNQTSFVRHQNRSSHNNSNKNSSNKSHTIHLRLRHPADHARFLPYEDVAVTFYSPSDGDFYLRPVFTYRHSDAWSITAGASLFGGDDEHTFFNQLQDASNAYLRFKYSY